MEEAEALCQRIGIVVAGQMRCLASPQRLKHLYGRGLQIDLAVAEVSTIPASIHKRSIDSPQASFAAAAAASAASDSSEPIQLMVDPLSSNGYLPVKSMEEQNAAATAAMELAVEAVEDFIENTFGEHASLIEKYQSRLKYRIEIEPLGMHLSDVFAMIEQNRGALKIADYSIGQATLEQVFISFARGTEQLLEEEKEANAAAALEQSGLSAEDKALLKRREERKKRKEKRRSHTSSSSSSASSAAAPTSQYTIAPSTAADLAAHVSRKYSQSLSNFLAVALGHSAAERLSALVASFEQQAVDLEAVVLFGVDGWQTPSRYTLLNVPMGLAIKIAARLLVEEQLMKSSQTGNQ
jgi:hypothetical protein